VKNIRSAQLLIVKKIQTEHIRDENAVELGRFQQLRQFDPMVDIVEAMRFILGVSP
jgi:hypothetical protein